MLRPEFGWRTHAVLVCAARSCPPLQRSAYTANTLNDQVARAYRTWLGRTDLNEFLIDKNEANVSTIFKVVQKRFRSSRWCEIDTRQNARRQPPNHYSRKPTARSPTSLTTGA